MTKSSNSEQLNLLKTYFNERKKEILEEYFTFLKFQSVSTDPTYRSQVLACSEWLTAYLQQMGFDVQTWQTSGYPTLFAEKLDAGEKAPTLLLYGHYDVQPVDPVQEWSSPPFEPTVKKGEVYARGAQDNKGQCFYMIQALKGILDREKRFPVNIKLCIEGEEECGSTGLAQLLQEKKRELQADYLAVVDMGIQEKNTPSITLGVRGLVALEVTVKGTHTDLHSGSHGGAAYNPIHALTTILASLRDSNGKVKVPGFYDAVEPLTEEEKKIVAWDFDEHAYTSSFGALPTGGEQQYSPLERTWIRPTLEINGISGGYGGAGVKTVIPAKASAKISCRLVPKQTPDEVAQKVKKFLIENAPKGVSIEVQVYPGKGSALRARPDSAIARAFSCAFSEVFDKTCSVIYSGGSIPVVAEMAKASGAEVVLVGLGLPDDQIHAPDEHFGLDRFEKGFLIISRMIALLSTL